MRIYARSGYYIHVLVDKATSSSSALPKLLRHHPCLVQPHRRRVHIGRQLSEGDVALSENENESTRNPGSRTRQISASPRITKLRLGLPEGIKWRPVVL